MPLRQQPGGSPSRVGFQGSNSLGVGRVSDVAAWAASSSRRPATPFNLLDAALWKTQGRIDILSRPQQLTLDNQQACILVGRHSLLQRLERDGDRPGDQTGIAYRDVGVQLQVRSPADHAGRAC